MKAQIVVLTVIALLHFFVLIQELTWWLCFDSLQFSTVLTAEGGDAMMWGMFYQLVTQQNPQKPSFDYKPLKY